MEMSNADKGRRGAQVRAENFKALNEEVARLRLQKTALITLSKLKGASHAEVMEVLGGALLSAEAAA